MRKWMGLICISLGILCMLTSVGFVMFNRWEDENAEKIAKSFLEDVQDVFKEQLPAPQDTEMATVKVDNYDCIGVLSIPALSVELPVLTEWSYEKLQKAPCHYYGSYHEGNFVIAAHNYRSHFGRLSKLQAGDLVVFTDVYGKAHYYEVAMLETLPKTATKEMITSGFELSLYSCTVGGGSRVTVRCNAAKNVMKQ